MIEVFTCLNNNYNSFTVSNILELNKEVFFDSWIINISGVVQISVTDSLIIMTIEVVSSTSGYAKIINVYDYTGKLLWCINDLFEKTTPIYGGFIVNKTRTLRDNNNYYSCFRGGQKIVIDLSNKKIIAVLPSK